MHIHIHMHLNNVREARVAPSSFVRVEGALARAWLEHAARWALMSVCIYIYIYIYTHIYIHTYIILLYVSESGGGLRCSARRIS